MNLHDNINFLNVLFVEFELEKLIKARIFGTFNK